MQLHTFVHAATVLLAVSVSLSLLHYVMAIPSVCLSVCLSVSFRLSETQACTAAKRQIV